MNKLITKQPSKLYYGISGYKEVRVRTPEERLLFCVPMVVAFRGQTVLDSGLGRV